MAKTKEIQRRIKSITSTRKITKAMEMVSASKMRKAVDSVLKTRTYANLSWVTILNLAKSMNNKQEKHSLLTPRGNIKNELIILITTNRGLCGSLNSSLILKTYQSIKKYSENKNIKTDFVILGKKGAMIHKHGYDIYAEFEKKDVISEIVDIRPISKMILEDYINGKYDKVLVAYTDFVNAITQTPRIKQLLPIDINSQEEYLGVVGKSELLKTDKNLIKEKEEKYLHDEYGTYEYLFEPNEKEVLDQMLPRLIEVQLFQALLESNASEHSARMNAMHNATMSANDLINELTLYYNKARQASITSEIAEISAGANALK